MVKRWSRELSTLNRLTEVPGDKMKPIYLLLVPAACCCVSLVFGADVSGTVKAIKGQRVTLATGPSAAHRVTISAPLDLRLKVGDRITADVQPIGDALLARSVIVHR